MTKDPDNLAIVVALAVVAILGFLFTPPAANAGLINLIVGGLLGYLAKTAQQSNVSQS